jgi:hypothetical protein
MKKLIKLLFPKAYQAIYDEGYNQAYYEYNKDYNQVYYDDYHDDYDDDYQQYQQYEPEMQRHHELQALHDEHYAEEANAWEEYRMKEEQELAELYLPKKPVLAVDDKIHLHSKQGMYTVVAVTEHGFTYCTKYSEVSYADYSDYKCHAGGRWNFKGN